MKNFMSPWLTAVFLALATVGAYRYLAPTGLDIGNAQILKAGQTVGWAIGPVAAVIFLIITGVLSLILRHRFLATIISLSGLFSFAWVLTGEPRFTPLARMVIDFGARPLLLGTLLMIIFVMVLFILNLLTAKK